MKKLQGRKVRRNENAIKAILSSYPDKVIETFPVTVVTKISFCCSYSFYKACPPKNNN